MFAHRDALTLRDALERRYDGPIPPADPAARPVAAAQRARLFQRLAHEARQQAAARRARVSASAATRDERLRRLAADLGRYRAHGLAWRAP